MLLSVLESLIPIDYYIHLQSMLRAKMLGFVPHGPLIETLEMLKILFQGSWIVKQSVGKKACLIGQALEINYFQGKNYLEVNIALIIN